MATLPPLAPRDFVRTTDGLLCAVLAWPSRPDIWDVWPRYAADETGTWRKLAAPPPTDDGGVRHVGPDQIAAVHGARAHLAHLLQQRAAMLDRLQAHAVQFARMLAAWDVPAETIGVTGSLLLGLHGPSSDIDVVVHGRPAFQQARHAMARLAEDGLVRTLTDDEWRDVHARRQPAIDVDTFVWHERRKGTRVMLDEVRIDLTMVAPPPLWPDVPGSWRPRDHATIEARVLDASAAFDYPASLRLDHPVYPDVLIFTNTYVGQARAGERVRVAGRVEEHVTGRHRLVVGTSREAPEEFIIVLADPATGRRDP